VNRFLKDHDLNMLIRSHEKKEEGFEFMFKKKLCTVFSASNYCDEHENDGAVMIINADLSYRFLTWNLDPSNAKVGMFCLRYALKQDVVLSKLVKRISRARLGLIAHWKKDAEKSAREQITSISRNEWAEGLSQVLRLKIDFLQFQDMLGLPKYGVKGKEGGPIDYMEFLSRFAPVLHHLKAEKSESQIEIKESLSKLSAVVAEMGYSLNTLFSYFDMSGKGKVTTEDFETGLLALKSLNQTASFTETEVEQLTKFFDPKETGYINFEEFFRGFTVHDNKLQKALTEFNRPRIPRRKGSVVLKTAPRLRGLSAGKTSPSADSREREDTEQKNTEPGTKNRSRNKGSKGSGFFSFFKRKPRTKSKG